MNKVPDRNTSSGSCSSQRKKAIRADALRNGVIAVFRFNPFGFNSPWLATKRIWAWVFDTPQLAAGLFIH